MDKNPSLFQFSGDKMHTFCKIVHLCKVMVKVLMGKLLGDYIA